MMAWGEVMDAPMTKQCLQQESVAYQGSGGVSGENRANGFMPAFCDSCTGRVYLSRFREGHLAPFHLLDGLPDEVVLRRDGAGRAMVAKSSLVSGFVRNGRLYTRDQAAAVVSIEVFSAACA